MNYKWGRERVVRGSLKSGSRTVNFRTLNSWPPAGGGGYYMGPGAGYYGGGGLTLVLLIVILFLLFGRGRGRL
jgi:hypothetical protein